MRQTGKRNADVTECSDAQREKCKSVQSAQHAHQLDFIVEEPPSKFASNHTEGSNRFSINDGGSAHFLRRIGFERTMRWSGFVRTGFLPFWTVDIGKWMKVQQPTEWFMECIENNRNSLLAVRRSIRCSDLWICQRKSKNLPRLAVVQWTESDSRHFFRQIWILKIGKYWKCFYVQLINEGQNISTKLSSKDTDKTWPDVESVFSSLISQILAFFRYYKNK